VTTYAGKSTVLHLVGGMDLPDEGVIEIGGTALVRRGPDAHRRRIGFVFQRFHLLLDSSTGREIIDLLLNLREEYGMTMLVATHDAEVAASCDRIVRLQDGKVTGDDTVAPAADVLDRLGGLRP